MSSLFQALHAVAGIDLAEPEIDEETHGSASTAGRHQSLAPVAGHGDFPSNAYAEDAWHTQNAAIAAIDVQRSFFGR